MLAATLRTGRKLLGEFRRFWGLVFGDNNYDLGGNHKAAWLCTRRAWPEGPPAYTLLVCGRGHLPF
jgi:hypothetical protein